MKPALVLVDIQRDYFPGGRMEVAGSDEASRAAKKLLEHFRRKRLPIVHVQHVSMRPGATFFLPDTDGVAIHGNVAPLEGEIVVQKHFPNSFRETRLHELLSSEGATDLVICGMMSQMCIDATVRAAFDLGYACRVAHDACAAPSLSFGSTSIPSTQVHGAYMAALGAVYAKVRTADEIIAAL